jgi:LysM repeat protein
MMRRAVFLLALLALPFPVRAAGYLVQPGDTLQSIAGRYHVSIAALAHLNGITNINYIQAGHILAIPMQVRLFYYHVRWGDTLLGIAAQFHLDLNTIRSLNPSLGPYPLAGQWLKLCGPCTGGSALTTAGSASGGTTGGASASGVTYVVHPGDTLTGIAGRYGVSLSALMTANGISNPDHIVIGSALDIPRTWTAAYDPWHARSLIVSYARQYGIDPSLPLAVAWQESGFNQSTVSRTGAVGVMQVEPYTGSNIEALTGRSFDLYNTDDNIHAGVYWLDTLLNYYGGNERLAVAAYYQGTRNLQRYGFFQDTVQYVNDVEALKSTFGG